MPALHRCQLARLQDRDTAGLQQSSQWGSKECRSAQHLCSGVGVHGLAGLMAGGAGKVESVGGGTGPEKTWGQGTEDSEFSVI